MLFKMIWEIKESSDCIGCVLFIPLYVAKVFSKSVAWLSSCFANEYLLLSASYAMDDIGVGARKMIRNFNGSLGSGYFLYVMNERTSYASCAPAFESSGLIRH